MGRLIDNEQDLTTAPNIGIANSGAGRKYNEQQ